MEGDLSVFNMTTQNILGINVTGGTWFNVKQSIVNSISGVSSLNTRSTTLTAAINDIAGTAENIASIANYYTEAQLSLAFASGLISDTGLVLSFKLKEDIFDLKPPLQKRSPIVGSGEVKNQIYLNIGPSLEIDANNKLAINTRDFLTPSYGDLGLLPTDNVLYPNSSSPSYIVIRKINNPLTCVSSLNVSGYSQFKDNATFCSNLNVSGYSNFNDNATFNSSLYVSGYSTFKNNATFHSNLNVVGVLNCSSVKYSSTQETTGDATFNSKLYVIGSSNLQGSLTVTGTSQFNNNISVCGTFNVSGSTTLANNTIINGKATCISSPNISGITKIGSNNIVLTDSVFEVHNNIAVRKNVMGGDGNTVNYGDKVDISVGTGLSKCYLSLQDGIDANLTSLKGIVGLNATTVSVFK